MALSSTQISQRDKVRAWSKFLLAELLTARPGGIRYRQVDVHRTPSTGYRFLDGAADFEPHKLGFISGFTALFAENDIFYSVVPHRILDSRVLFNGHDLLVVHPDDSTAPTTLVIAIKDNRDAEAFWRTRPYVEVVVFEPY